MSVNSDESYEGGKKYLDITFTIAGVTYSPQSRRERSGYFQAFLCVLLALLNFRRRRNPLVAGFNRANLERPVGS
jgi:hypothetical protein